MAMALLESIMIPLGTVMPDFDLRDPSGQSYNGRDLYGEKGLMLAFLCNHCPYALAVWPRFIRLAQYAESAHIHTAAINPNIHPDYPEDAPEKMLEKIREWGIPFPYLVDEAQSVARSFKAQCTPDIFLFNKGRKLVYHGRLDDNWQDESKVVKEDLREALTNLITGEPPVPHQKPSMGCSIKWHKP
jgi:peroxiredoxin